MNKLSIAVLSGGKSHEREVSLNSGKQVCAALDPKKYSVIHYDPATDLANLVNDAHKIDFAFIVLHGSFGEDGTIQGLLELLNIPYQGSGVLGSAIAMNKLASKKLYEHAMLPVPTYYVLRKNGTFSLKQCLTDIGLPMIVKPVEGGSSIGMSIVKSADELDDALHQAFSVDSTVLLEKKINGIELTCGVIGNNTIEALPVVEIIPNKEFAFFNYIAKYTPGATNEICPARIPDHIAKKAQDYAIRAHQVLFCRGYSRTDMILEGDECYLLETNTIPGMTATSLLPLAANVSGISFSELLDKLISLGLEKV
ncbi:MAG: D-alanine--D-alanine ligase [Desulfobacterales bacterium]|nr:D-alanine--D-alanine ligase [Desulfobacterales bacterium]